MGKPTLVTFQSPVLGVFLCFLVPPFVNIRYVNKLSIPSFRGFSLFQHGWSWEEMEEIAFNPQF